MTTAKPALKTSVQQRVAIIAPALTQDSGLLRPTPGSCFRAGERFAAAGPSVNAQGKPKMRILLVAEPSLLADGVARSLAQIGRDVQVTVCEPAQALDRNLEPQLIVLDVDTTAGKTSMLIAHFKERFPYAPVVALAGEMEEPSSPR